MIVVCGAGGFIGGHLVRNLLKAGHQVRAVDLKPVTYWHQRFPDAENLTLDLRLLDASRVAVEGAREVFNLACDMGGMGFIANNRTLCMLNVLINTHTLMASRDAGVERYFYASSACVYARGKQICSRARALAESDAYPAMPEDGYGWEKLFSERMCRHFSEDFELPTRVARLHNVYGPFGVFDGGREKAPAAICRKIIQAKLEGKNSVEIWGDGKQTRSFMYIDDCIEGIHRIMNSEIAEPINLGSAELVSINKLVDIIEMIADVKLKRRYRLDAPTGVRGRNSDNSMIRRELGWEPSIQLTQGLVSTYKWIYDEMSKAGTP